MDDARPMGPVETLRDLDAVAKRFLARQCTFVEALRERFAFEVLHHQEIDTVLVPDVVYRANIRMIELGQSFRLAL